MKFIIYFVCGVATLLGCQASASLQGIDCPIVCQGFCGDGLTFQSNETTLCHTYPCKCVPKSDPGRLFINRPEGKTLEGDILVHPQQEELVKGVYGKTPVPRSIFHIKRFYWTKYKHQGLYYVPYVLDHSITDNVILENIQHAFREFKKNTCVRFVARSSQENYIRIKSGGGCFAHIGMNGGEQTVSLQNKGCQSRGTAIHELMHSIGFFHEQSRSDRDQYIRINKHNIIKGLEGNFEKRTSAVSLGSPYDYGSVMHYSLDAFSKNNRDTIIPIRQTKANIGQREGFSEIDIQQINLLYPCEQVNIRKANRPSPSAKRPTLVRRPTTAQPTTTTPPVKKCKDEINNCDSWMSKGYCARDNRFFKLAMKYCAKSCRTCHESTRPTTTTSAPRTTSTTPRYPNTVPAVKVTCFDQLKATTCRSWALKGYCFHRVYSSYLSKKCKKSCNQCEVQVPKDEMAPLIQKDQMSSANEDSNDVYLNELMREDA